MIMIIMIDLAVQCSKYIITLNSIRSIILHLHTFSKYLVACGKQVFKYQKFKGYCMTVLGFFTRTYDQQYNLKLF